MGDEIASLPPESRALVKTVTVNPVANPQDAYWAKAYDMPGFVSWMTCGAKGGVSIYPLNYAEPVDESVNSLTHETGHAWSMAAWGGDDSGPKWAAWNQAISEDGPITPSQYAESSPEEDVAESTALYLNSRGTPAFDEYRQLFPNRFAILDRQFGRGVA